MKVRRERDKTVNPGWKRSRWLLKWKGKTWGGGVNQGVGCPERCLTDGCVPRKGF